MTTNQTAINTTCDKPAKRTSQATYAAQVKAAQRRQEQLDTILADILAFCPEFLIGEALHAATVGM